MLEELKREAVQHGVREDIIEKFTNECQIRAYRMGVPLNVALQCENTGQIGLLRSLMHARHPSQTSALYTSIEYGLNLNEEEILLFTTPSQSTALRLGLAMSDALRVTIFIQIDALMEARKAGLSLNIEEILQFRTGAQVFAINVSRRLNLNLTLEQILAFEDADQVSELGFSLEETLRIKLPEQVEALRISIEFNLGLNIDQILNFHTDRHIKELALRKLCLPVTDITLQITNRYQIRALQYGVSPDIALHVTNECQLEAAVFGKDITLDQLALIHNEWQVAAMLDGIPVREAIGCNDAISLACLKSIFKPKKQEQFVDSPPPDDDDQGGGGGSSASTLPMQPGSGLDSSISGLLVQASFNSVMTMDTDYQDSIIDVTEGGYNITIYNLATFTMPNNNAVHVDGDNPGDGGAPVHVVGAIATVTS